LTEIRERIAGAARRAGRDASSVKILAVSKRHPAATVAAALDAGLVEFGENQVMEAIAKIPLVRRPASWHFIGRIQSNKTRPIAEYFDWVQTICTHKAAERLNRQRPQQAANLQVCIQLRPAHAPQRSGAEQDEVAPLAEFIMQLPRLDLRGLMMIPLPDQDEASLRAEFRRARQLMESLQDISDLVDTLSMGMSADLETAVMEGSTMVRIGTDLFGPRDR